MPRLGVTVLAAAAVAAGCAGEPREFPPNPLACRGTPAPVDEETLVRTLARYGFELEREEFCEGFPGEPAAMFTNIPEAIYDTREGKVIFASDGLVSCELFERSRYGREMRRRRVVDEVEVRALNVLCFIYEAHAWQVERLGDAVHQLTIEVG